MAKSITNNVRGNDQLAMLHLFEFDMYNFDGTFDETLRFTDHDIFVDYDGYDWTPLAITFDKLSEDGSMQSDSISITLDNVSGAITSEALASEWRNNRAKITRVIYMPEEDTIGGETYEFGYGDNLTTYPELDLDAHSTKDVYTLFEGIIDTFGASESTLNGMITTLFTNWNKAYPTRTFNQTEFQTIIDTMTDELSWGH